MRKLLLVLGLTLLLAVSFATVSAQVNTGSAEVRFIHVAQDVDEADVYVNGELRSFGRSVEYGTISGWIRVPAGETTLEVRLAGRSQTLVGPVTLDIAADSRTNVYVYGAARTEGVDAVVVPESDLVLAETGARVTVFHGIPQVGPVNLLAGGSPILNRVAHPGTLTLAGGGTNDGAVDFDVPAGTYDLAVTPNNDNNNVLIDLPGTTLEAGMKYLVVAAIVDGEPTVIVAASD